MNLLPNGLSGIAIYTCLSFILAACSNNSNDELAHHHHDHGTSHENHNHEAENHDHEAEGRDGHEGHNHGAGDEIILEPEQADRFNVTTSIVEPGTFYDVLKVSGQIVDAPDAAAVIVAPVSGVVNFTSKAVVGTQISKGGVIAHVKPTAVTGGDPNAAALAAIKAAQQEVARLKPLHERGIVSTAEYNRALATLETARASYSPAAASGAAVASVSGTITQLLASQGQFVEAGTPIASLSGSGKLTLRADLPQKYYEQALSINSAKIKMPYSSEIIDIAEYGGKRTTTSQLVSAQPGYIPIYFTLNNNGKLVPGSFVEVYLIGKDRQNVITVPVTALSEQQGNFYVYIKIDDEGYLKSPVTLGVKDGDRVEIKSGLHAGDNVVVTGTATVRLAESSNVIPEGHSHNH